MFCWISINILQIKNISIIIIFKNKKLANYFVGMAINKLKLYDFDKLKTYSELIL